MPSEVSNAVGTSRQFSVSTQSVYRRRLQELPLQWNVGVARDNSLEDLSHIFNSGILRQQDDKLKLEQSRATVAEALAPMLYGKASEEDKRTLNTIALVSKSGKFNLSENKYLLATLDKMRGEDSARQAGRSYYQNVYLVNPLPKDSEEERKRREDYINNWSRLHNEDIDYSHNITNPLAYDMGFNNKNLELTFQQEQQYDRDLEVKTKADIESNIINFAQDTFAELDKLDYEGINNKVDNAVQHATSLLTSDNQFNKRVVDSMLTLAVQNGGLNAYTSIVNSIGEDSQLRPYLDTPSLETKAQASERVLWTKWWESTTQKLMNCETFEQAKSIAESETDNSKRKLLKSNLESLYKALSSIRTTRGRIAQARGIRGSGSSGGGASNYSSTISGLSVTSMTDVSPKEWEETEKANTTSYGLADAIVYGQGKFMFNGSLLPVPTSATEARGMGLDPNAIRKVLTDRFLQEVANGDVSAIQMLFSHPLCADNIKALFRQSVPPSLQATSSERLMTPIMKTALTLSTLKPWILEESLGKNTADSLVALNELIEAHGQEQGGELFLSARETIRNSGNLFDKAIPNGDIIVGATDVDTGDTVKVSLSSTGINSDVYRRFVSLAKYYMAVGSPKGEALEQAKTVISKEYFPFHGGLLPRSICNEKRLPDLEGVLNSIGMNYFGLSEGEHKAIQVELRGDKFVFTCRGRVGLGFTDTIGSLFRDMKFSLIGSDSEGTPHFKGDGATIANGVGSKGRYVVSVKEVLQILDTNYGQKLSDVDKAVQEYERRTK